MHIGARIRKARIEAGLEQAELAAAIGVAPNTVWKWEARQAAPRSALVEKLAAALGKPVGWLYGEEQGEVTIGGVPVTGSADTLAQIVGNLRTERTAPPEEEGSEPGVRALRDDRDLRQRLGITDEAMVLLEALRWPGHVETAQDAVRIWLSTLATATAVRTGDHDGADRG